MVNSLGFSLLVILEMAPRTPCTIELNVYYRVIQKFKEGLDFRNIPYWTTSTCMGADFVIHCGLNNIADLLKVIGEMIEGETADRVVFKYDTALICNL